MNRMRGMTSRLAVLMTLVALATGAIAACAGCFTPLGADKAMGSFGQGGYLFLRWQEGVEVMIWHDLAGEGTGHSASSNAGRLYVERGSVRLADGRSLAWELQTADGKTGKVQIDGIRYDLAAGTLFIVTTQDGTRAVRQLSRDLSAVPLDRDGILAFARNDLDLAPLLDENVSAPPKAGPGITIVGIVKDVSLSTRVIALAEPVDGFSVVALTPESELLSADGNEIAPRDIQPGMRIEASGVPGESEALLASEVHVLP